jgi:hypothetical protein
MRPYTRSERAMRDVGAHGLEPLTPNRKFLIQHSEFRIPNP